MSDFSFPKHEKLKSKKAIEHVFAKGKKVYQFPITLLYVTDESFENEFQIGVSVSKRYFKKAVDRNRIKRLLRECYRLHKPLLKSKLPTKTSCFLLYQHNEKISFKELEAKYLQLIEKIQ